MAKAFKCDRCGVLYKAGLGSEARVVVVPDGVQYYRKEWNLCPNCQKELEDWMMQRNEGLQWAERLEVKSGY